MESLVIYDQDGTMVVLLRTISEFFHDHLYEVLLDKVDKHVFHSDPVIGCIEFDIVCSVLAQEFRVLVPLGRLSCDSIDTFHGIGILHAIACTLLERDVVLVVFVLLEVLDYHLLQSRL